MPSIVMIFLLWKRGVGVIFVSISPGAISITCFAAVSSWPSDWHQFIISFSLIVWWRERARRLWMAVFPSFRQNLISEAPTAEEKPARMEVWYNTARRETKSANAETL